MVTAFPGGDEQRPTRQTLNKAIQYATNGILYFLVHGVPDWSAEAQYAAGSIVRYQNRFFLAVGINTGVAPDGDSEAWELLPWRKEALDAMFLNREHGDIRFLTFAAADERFYTKLQMDALFITPPEMALLYVTQAALEAEYITREQAISTFLTVALADERYAIYAETVSHQLLAEMLEEYLTIAEGKNLFLTVEGSDATLLNRERAGAIYLTPEDARERFEAKVNAAISRYRPEMIYGFGVLAFDPEEKTIYRSLADDNVGHALDDEEYWAEWTPPYAEPTGAGTWLHTLGHDASGTYNVAFEDVVPSETETHGEVLMRFRLKAGGGGGYEAGGGGEGAELTVMAVMQESAFPLRLVVGGPGQHSSVSTVGNPLLQVNCGGDALDTWRADEGYDSGAPASNDDPVDVSRADRPAPMEVYQSVRHSNGLPTMVYTFSDFVPGALNLVRLHFCEGIVVPGQRVFDVDINGQRVLTNFDVFVAAGGSFIAHIESFAVPADASGQYVITFLMRAEVPVIHGIEITSITTLLSVSPGSDANVEEPGLGGDQAMVGLTRGLMSVEKIPGAHGKFAWPGFRGGDGGGVHGGSGEPLRRINCASGVYGTWGEDAGFDDGGSGHGDPHPDAPIDITRTLRPAPEAIYRSVRMKDPIPLVYTFGGYAPGSHQVVRLHFCELWTEGDWPHRRFRVVVNDRPMLEFFNIMEAAGGARIANVQTTLAAANAQGQIVITFTAIVHPPIIAAIEIFPSEPIPSSMAGIDCGHSPIATRVNAGGPAMDSWRANDGIFNEPHVGHTDDIPDLTGVSNPAPAAVYQTVRFAPHGTVESFTATIPARPHRSYLVRLHFFSAWSGAVGDRVFRIGINGQIVEDHFDLFARAGAQTRVAIAEYMIETGDAPSITIGFENIVSDAMISGIETILQTGWEDRWYSGGHTTAAQPGQLIDMSRVERPAPEEIYQTCRFGGGIGGTTPEFRYNIPPSSATPGWIYRLRLHFCENWSTGGALRIFNVAVNNRWIVQNFNVAERAGGNSIAYVLETDVMALSNGLDIWFGAIEGGSDPILNGIEMMWMGGAMPPDASPAVMLGGGGNSEWGPSVRPGAAGFIFVDW